MGWLMGCLHCSASAGDLGTAAPRSGLLWVLSLCSFLCLEESRARCALVALLWVCGNGIPGVMGCQEPGGAEAGAE